MIKMFDYCLTGKINNEVNKHYLSVLSIETLKFDKKYLQYSIQ